MKYLARLLSLLVIGVISHQGIAQPVVKSVFPSQNKINVPTNTDITFTFNVPINTSTLSEANILVHGSQSGKHNGIITLHGDSSITFQPNQNFFAGEIVTVNLTKKIQSATGDSLKNGYHWSFTVATATSTGAFASKVDYPTGTGPSSICMGDIDGDGDNDLAITNWGSQSVSILKNKGDGTFEAKVDSLTEQNPISVTINDIDNDGDGDLVVVGCKTSKVSILKNKGDGTFESRVNYSVANVPYWVCVGDLDGDGYSDIVTANYYSNKVSVLKNLGDGTFAPKVDYPVGTGPFSVFISDLDGDGYNDIVTANYNSSNISFLKNLGDGTFATKVDYPVGNGPEGIFVSDIDGDGNGDIVVADANANTISVLKNNGNGTFAPRAYYLVDNHPQSVFVNDIDGDGDGDIVAANWGAGANSVSVLKNNGNGTFEARVDYTTGTQPTCVVLGDVDGDGACDIAVPSQGLNKVSILTNIRLTTVPSKPTNLASSTTRSKITLTWQQSQNYPNGYYIYSSSQQSGPYTKIGTSLFNSYSDSNLLPLTTRWYYIIAYNNLGNSPPSNLIQATTLTDVVSSPNNLTVTNVSVNTVSLRWRSVPSVAYYNIYMRNEAEPQFSLVATSTDTTETIGGLISLTHYISRVSAVKATGESNRSDSVNAITLAGNISFDLVEANPMLLKINYPPFPGQHSLLSIFNNTPLFETLKRKGVCADGVAKLFLRLKSNYRPASFSITLKDDDETINAAITGTVSRITGESNLSQLTLNGNDFDSLGVGNFQSLVLYTSPIDFVRPTSPSLDAQLFERDVLVTVEAGSDGNQSIIKVRRPPLVLGHGLWADSTTWDKFYPNLHQVYRRQASVFRFDYKTTNSSYFLINNKKLLDFLQYNVLPSVYRSGYSCSQVDYVGHSMGGILARLSTQWTSVNIDKLTFSKGFVHKLITVNTPHLGTWFANYLVNATSLPVWMDEKLQCKARGAWGMVTYLSNLGNSTTNGAIADLSFGSNSLRKISKTNVPSHAVASYWTDSWEALDVWRVRLLFGVINLWGGCPPKYFTPFDIATGFHNDDNDMIVSLHSQKGGLISPGVTVIDNNVHTNILNDPRTVSRVEELLDASVSDGNIFAQFPGVSPYFPVASPEIIASNSTSSPSDLKNSLKNTLTSDDFVVDIVSPDSTFIPSPGSEFRLSLAVSDTSKLKFILIAAPGILDLDTTKNLTKSVTVPYDYIGGYKLYVFAFDTSGYLGVDSLTYELNPSSTLSSINVEPDSLILYRTDDGYPLAVFGQYSDNAVRNLTSLSNVIYQSSDTTIAVVTNTGLVKPIKSGQVFVKVSYGDQNDSISINVIDDNAVLPIHPVDGDTSIAIPSIQFIWQKNHVASMYQFELSREVDFSTFEGQDSSIADTTTNYSGLQIATYYFWRVRAKVGGLWQPYSPIRIFRTRSVTSVHENEIVREYRLEQCYPNPFNPTTTIKYQLPVRCQIVLRIYNVLGQVVETLTNEVQNQGHQIAEWNASNVASGVYFYRLEAVDLNNPANSYMQVRKMLFVK